MAAENKAALSFQEPGQIAHVYVHEGDKVSTGTVLAVLDTATLRTNVAQAKALDGVCTMEHCASLEDAVVAGSRAARPGDTVLLSPACASLDMFRDYSHRGAVFTAAVKGLAA